MKKTVYYFSAMCFMLFLMLASLFWVGNNDNFYLKQYVNNNTMHYTGMDMTDLLKATDLLQDYLNDNTDSLDMTVAKWGVEKELFDSREKTHMVDVKVLYLTFEKIMYGLAAVSAAGFGFMFCKDKKGFGAGISKGFKFCMAITAVFCLFFAVVFMVGFDSFWTLFHKIMFTNDLWLLDPKISTMINMFPLNFWLAMCTQALVLFACLFATSFAAVSVWKRKTVKG